MKKPKIEPQYKEMAKKAAIWAGSEEGQTAHDQAVEAGREGARPLREAERVGRERINRI